MVERVHDCCLKSESTRYEQTTSVLGLERAGSAVRARVGQSSGACSPAQISARGVVGQLSRSLQCLGKLNDAEKQKAASQLAVLNRGWREVLPGDHLRDLATRLLDTYELRAADSLQLAAALTWCQQRPRRRDFLCGDERLGKAALAAGFSVLDIS